MNLPELKISLDFHLPEADMIVDTREKIIELPVLEPDELDFGYDVNNDMIGEDLLVDDRDPDEYRIFFVNYLKNKSNY